jgi:hypothetical protein
MQQGNIGLGDKMAATSEEGEDEAGDTGATYGKSENIT